MWRKDGYIESKEWREMWKVERMGMHGVQCEEIVIKENVLNGWDYFLTGRNVWYNRTGMG